MNRHGQTAFRAIRDLVASPSWPRARQHWRGPVQTTKVSVIVAINMLGLAKRAKAKILQASTSEVYGSPEQFEAHNTWPAVKTAA